MLDHVSIGVRDYDTARRFYDAALAPLGFTRLVEFTTDAGYGRDAAQFWIIQAPQPVPAHAGSGLHFCFRAEDRGAVDAFHGAALQAGGQDNGAPGLREEYGADYYAAFITDPDGYRIEAYCSKPQA